MRLCDLQPPQYPSEKPGPFTHRFLGRAQRKTPRSGPKRRSRESAIEDVGGQRSSRPAALLGERRLESGGDGQKQRAAHHQRAHERCDDQVSTRTVPGHSNAGSPQEEAWETEGVAGQLSRRASPTALRPSEERPRSPRAGHGRQDKVGEVSKGLEDDGHVHPGAAGATQATAAGHRWLGTTCGIAPAIAHPAGIPRDTGEDARGEDPLTWRAHQRRHWLP